MKTLNTPVILKFADMAKAKNKPIINSKKIATMEKINVILKLFKKAKLLKMLK